MRADAADAPESNERGQGPTATELASGGGHLAIAASEARGDFVVRLWEPVWEVAKACELAGPYVTKAQVQSFMPFGREPACRYPI